MNHPLTDEQIWGVPENELPAPKQKDYFEVRDHKQPETIDDLARRLARIEQHENSESVSNKD